MIVHPDNSEYTIPPALKLPIDEVSIVKGGKEEEEVKELTEKMFDVKAADTQARVEKAKKKAPKPKENKAGFDDMLATMLVADTKPQAK